MNDIKLEGCSPVPMAHYLKALGIFRVIAEQKDSKVRGYWKDDKFHIRTDFDAKDLVDFFMDEYGPTPVVSPWNGGSGFGPKDYQDAILAIESTSSSRFENYRKAIEIGRIARDDMGIDHKVTSENKEDFLIHCRNRFQEDVLDWLDSVVVLTDNGAKYPPLLGTGGNDGRLEFSKNYMQNICLCLINGDEKSMPFLENSLFNYPILGMEKNAIGQFFPSATGGANAQSGFDANSCINPWDYIFMIEGTLFFTSACAKKHSKSQGGTLSYPFSVKSVAAGFGSSATDDAKTSRDEIWFPLWEKRVSYAELRVLFSEGRSNIKGRSAHNSIDFARSLATLGVDRGLSEFQRYGFMLRNGRSYFATPLGRFVVKRQPHVDLIDDIDPWITTFRNKAGSDVAPGSITQASSNLDKAIMSLCNISSNLKLQNVLIELGKCEKEMVKSSSWAKTSYIQPVPYLSKGWLKECDDGTPEYRLAVSLASIYGKYGHRYFSIRKNAEPVIDGRKVFFKFEENEDFNEVVDSSGSLVDFMNSVLSRRLIKAQQEGCETYPDRAGRYASIGDITDFIEGRVNEHKILDLFWGMILVNWKDGERVEIQSRDQERSLTPNAGYMLVKLCYSGVNINDRHIPIIPQIHRLARNGNGSGAVDMAVRRLRAIGVSPSVKNMYLSLQISKRIAAAVLFPVHERQIKEFLSRITVESNDTVMEITQEV